MGAKECSVPHKRMCIRYAAASLAFASELIHVWISPGQLVAAILPGAFFLPVLVRQEGRWHLAGRHLSPITGMPLRAIACGPSRQEPRLPKWRRTAGALAYISCVDRPSAPEHPGLIALPGASGNCAPLGDFRRARVNLVSIAY